MLKIMGKKIYLQFYAENVCLSKTVVNVLLIWTFVHCRKHSKISNISYLSKGLRQTVQILIRLGSSMFAILDNNHFI